MIDVPRLRGDLQRLLRDTEISIQERMDDSPELEAGLRHQHAAAAEAGRAASGGWNGFREEAITQAAVHWLLGCVFVRFLEDNDWLVGAWIAGPGGRQEIARARRTLYLRQDAALTDRDYLLHIFGEVAKLPGMGGLFDRRHNPLTAVRLEIEQQWGRIFHPGTAQAASSVCLERRLSGSAGVCRCGDRQAGRSARLR